MNFKLKTIAEMQTSRDKLVARAQSNCNILNELYANLSPDCDLLEELSDFEKMLDQDNPDANDLCDCIDRTSDMLADGQHCLEEYQDDIVVVESRPNLKDREN